MTEPSQEPVSPDTAADEKGPQEGQAEADDGAFLRLLSWPPPGLARTQGDLAVVVRKVLVAAVILVLPLLLVVTVPQAQPGLGPLGESWWLTLVSTALGLLLFLDATVTLFRVLRRVRLAIKGGYAISIVATVLADSGRDAGFLLQGAQHFSVMPKDTRDSVLRMRIAAPLLQLGAGLWMLVGFTFLLVLAARGGVSASGVVLGTLVPSALLIFAGLVLRALQGSREVKARKAWFKESWAQDLRRRGADEWREAAAQRGTRASGDGGGLWAGRTAMGVVVAAAVIAIVPYVTLIPASSIHLAAGAVGGSSYYWTAQKRVAEVEPYRLFALPPEPQMTAQDAGETLNTLINVGQGGETANGMLDPVRTYDAGWIPEAPVAEWPTDRTPFWTDSIWAGLAGGLSPQMTEYLGEVAANPAHAEFALLARVSDIDILGTRYELPFADDMLFWSVPFPPYRGLREAANAHLGIAALRVAQGRSAEAEEAIREVISVGFILMDESPLLIGNMIGSSIVQAGGDALVQALLLDGRFDEAERLAASVDAAERAVALMAAGSAADAGWQNFFEKVPEVVSNPTTTRGLRWELFGILSQASPCLNLQRVVFGPDGEYLRWVDQTRAALVRHPAEEELFDVMLRGMVARPPTALERALAVTMNQVTCTQILSEIGQMM